MKKRCFQVSGKAVTLYSSSSSNVPLIVLNTYTGDGSSVVQELEKLGPPEHHLLVIGNLEWNVDMCPWNSPALSKREAPCFGGADAYLNLLETEILSRVKDLLPGSISWMGIAGYSLAGLFSIYALYRSTLFSRAASASGSLWYPHFSEFVRNSKMRKLPEMLYFSLGDQEAKTQHPVLKTVQENTESIFAHYVNLGIPAFYELNAGNHFKEPAWRMAKGILAILA